MISSGNSTGTAFTLDVPGHESQYLITARHVVVDDGPLAVRHLDGWFRPKCRPIGSQGDLTAFSLDEPISRRDLTLEITDFYSLGQPCWFAGFPQGLVRYLDFDGTRPNIPYHFPIPVVKFGIMSYFGKSGGNLIDAQCNAGFSGSPVVVTDNVGWKVAGVIVADVRQRLQDSAESAGLAAFEPKHKIERILGLGG